MNYLTECKDIVLNKIDENKNIPSEAKIELKALIRQQFQVIKEVIGVVELLYLRETQETLKP